MNVWTVYVFIVSTSAVQTVDENSVSAWITCYGLGAVLCFSLDGLGLPGNIFSCSKPKNKDGLEMSIQGAGATVFVEGSLYSRAIVKVSYYSRTKR